MLVLFASTLLAGLRRIRLGIDLADEGMYLVAPMRYALGDVPFRDEFLNPLRMFDIVLWPVFELWPDVTVHQLRVSWLVIQLACAFSVYRVFKPFAPRVLPALACVSTLYVANVIWTPGYHGMGTFLFALAWSLWLMASLSSRGGSQLGLGSLAGLVFYLASMSYFPLLAVLAIPGLVLLSRRKRWKSRDGRLIATGTFLATASLCWLLTFLGFWYFDVLTDWFSAQSTVLQSDRYRNSPFEMLAEFLRQTFPFLIPFGASVMGTIGLVELGSSSRWIRSTGSSGHPALRTVPLGIVTCVFLLILIFLVELPVALPALVPDWPIFMRSFRLFSVALGLPVGIWIHGRFDRRESTDEAWRFVQATMLSASLLLAFLHGFLSGMAFKAMFVTMPVFVAGIVMLYRALLAAAGSSRRPEFASASLAVAVCIGIGAGSCSLMFEPPYGDRPLVRLTEEFTNPRLAGIWSAPGRVDQLDRTSAWISARTEPGDLLLVEGHSALLYFLTGTRPALDHSWTAPETPGETRQRSVEKMIAARRVPEFAVSSRILPARPGSPRPPAGGPIQEFILQHYVQLARIGSYGLWRRIPPDPGL